MLKKKVEVEVGTTSNMGDYSSLRISVRFGWEDCSDTAESDTDMVEVAAKLHDAVQESLVDMFNRSSLRFRKAGIL